MPAARPPGPPEPSYTATEARAAEGSLGRILYHTYCEACHGPGGRGNGQAASLLRNEPSDLTRLGETFGRPLERDRLERYIDGRWLVDAHGPRAMPIWGEEFFKDAPEEARNLDRVRERLVHVLVSYLEDIQS